MDIRHDCDWCDGTGREEWHEDRLDSRGEHYTRAYESTCLECGGEGYRWRWHEVPTHAIRSALLTRAIALEARRTALDTTARVTLASGPYTVTTRVYPPTRWTADCGEVVAEVRRAGRAVSLADVARAEARVTGTVMGLDDVERSIVELVLDAVRQEPAWDDAELFRGGMTLADLDRLASECGAASVCEVAA